MQTENTSFWDDADKLVKTPNTPVVCCTISKFGMCAYHTSAAVMDPIGDYHAVSGETIRAGLQSAPAPDGEIHIRPGYEDQVREQLAQHRDRLAVRPISLVLPGESELKPEMPDMDKDIPTAR